MRGHVTSYIPVLSQYDYQATSELCHAKARSTWQTCQQVLSPDLRTHPGRTIPHEGLLEDQQDHLGTPSQTHHLSASPS